MVLVVGLCCSIWCIYLLVLWFNSLIFVKIIEDKDLNLIWVGEIYVVLSIVLLLKIYIKGNFNGLSWGILCNFGYFY